MSLFGYPPAPRSLSDFGIVGCKSTGRPPFYRLLAPARGAPDSYALKRYDSAAPWNNYAAVNPAKNGLGGVDFGYTETS